MGRRTVIVRVNHQTYDAVCSAVPKDSMDDDYTVSGWIRLIVETLVARPETNLRRRALMGLEGRYGLVLPGSKTLRCKLAFRVEAEHWAALTTLARAPGKAWGGTYNPPRERPGMSRLDYFRRMVHIGSGAKGEWYERYGEDEDARTDRKNKVYGPSLESVSAWLSTTNY